MESESHQLVWLLVLVLRLVFLVRFQSSTATPPADLTAGLTLPDAVEHGYITHEHIKQLANPPSDFEQKFYPFIGSVLSAPKAWCVHASEAPLGLPGLSQRQLIFSKENVAEFGSFDTGITIQQVKVSKSDEKDIRYALAHLIYKCHFDALSDAESSEILNRTEKFSAISDDHSICQGSWRA